LEKHNNDHVERTWAYHHAMNDGLHNVSEEDLEVADTYKAQLESLIEQRHEQVGIIMARFVSGKAHGLIQADIELPVPPQADDVTGGNGLVLGVALREQNCYASGGLLSALTQFQPGATFLSLGGGGPDFDDTTMGVAQEMPIALNSRSALAKTSPLLAQKNGGG